MNDDVKEFCHKYQAYIGKSSRVWRRAQSVPYDVWTKSPDVFPNITCEDVPMVEITMPEDRFRALLEHDEWISQAGLHDNQHFANNVSRVSQMIVDHEHEAMLRKQYPALEIAWEKYQTLLRVCR